MIRDAAVLLLPILTGLCGLMWSEVASKSGAWATACGAIAYTVVAIGFSFSASTNTMRPSVASLVALTVLSGVVSVLWVVPITSGACYVSLALIEGAWPIFSILFAWLLFRRLELDGVSAVGGALIIVGAALVYNRA